LKPSSIYSVIHHFIGDSYLAIHLKWRCYGVVQFVCKNTVIVMQ